MSVAVDYQVHRTAVNLAKGYRQIEKAATALSKGNVDSASNHLSKAADDFATAVDHAAKAADDACAAVGKEIDKGNADLQKCVTAYANGDTDAAQKDYAKAVECYGKALDMIDSD